MSEIETHIAVEQFLGEELFTKAPGLEDKPGALLIYSSCKPKAQNAPLDKQFKETTVDVCARAAVRGVFSVLLCWSVEGVVCVLSVGGLKW
jgi:hypothetical protein